MQPDMLLSQRTASQSTDGCARFHCGLDAI
jgi:hypothetical protein